jgi:predicted dienelactone hydrolase
MDVINQPADISFVIDTLLSWNDKRGELLHRRIDPARIALIGHSLGGMTTTLAAYHPRLRDQRVAAAVSLAGPLEMFGRQLFEAHDIPFL